MKKIVISLLFLLTAITGFSAPIDRSIREIRDIVGSPQLRHYLPPYESILNIRRVDQGYLITTNHYQLLVEIIYPMQGAQADGDKAGELRFNKPTEIK